MTFSSDVVHDLFYILICRLRLLRINNMNVVVFLDFQRISIHLICIKYKNHGTFLKSLIVA